MFTSYGTYENKNEAENKKNLRICSAIASFIFLFRIVWLFTYDKMSQCDDLPLGCAQDGKKIIVNDYILNS